MRIRYATYPTAFMMPGGGEVQLLKTLDAVKKQGFDIDCLDHWSPFGKGKIDVLHVFSVCNSVELYADMCRHLGIRFIVSPILWPTAYYEAERNRIRKVLLSADAILPNSKAEKHRIIESLDIPDQGQFFVVPNGVDAEFFREIERSKERIQKDQVLCVANIDTRKNLRVLAQACRNLGMQLTLYGDIRDHDYFDGLVRDFGEVLEYRGKFKNGSKEHIAILQTARIFALSSDYETPGLAAIEAGAAGVPVVVTSVGSAPEYFRDYANYCDPTSEDSVSEALRQSMQAPMVLDDQARDHFASHSWEKVGLATIRAYQNIKRFDAADLFSNVGIVAGSTRIVDPTSGDGQGFVTYGPYAVFSPGSYTITVHYQSSDSIHEVVSQFEVFDANSDSMIFTTAMSGTGGDMATPTYHVNFDFTTMGKIEFRIFWFGRFRLVVERIEIAPLG